MQTIKQESEKYRFILEKACCDGISVKVRNEILKLKHKKLIYIYIYIYIYIKYKRFIS